MSKLSPAARSRLANLEMLSEKVHRVHALVEMYATARSRPEQYLIPMGRLFGKLRMEFMGAGLDAMSQLCGSMETVARRGLAPASKVRILREGVGSLRFQYEMEQRAIIAEDEAARKKEAEAEESS
jgi:hypothetical protein